MLRGVRPRRASAWLLVASALASASALAALSERLSDEVLALSAAASAVELVIAALALAAALLAPGSARARLGLLSPRFGMRDTAVLAAGTLALSHALDALLAQTGLYEQSELAGFARSMHGARGLPLGVALLAIGLLPAAAEELLCRGVLQRSLVPRLGPAVGIALASFAFGALHVEPVHAAFAVLLGAYLGLVGHWSGSVFTPIVCHAVNNGLATLISALCGPTPSGSPAEVAVGLGLAAGALGWVRRRAQPGLQPASGLDDG
jgi:membrane protease YdiL (CAAX protease family)